MAKKQTPPKEDISFLFSELENTIKKEMLEDRSKAPRYRAVLLLISEAKNKCLLS